MTSSSHPKAAVSSRALSLAAEDVDRKQCTKARTTSRPFVCDSDDDVVAMESDDEVIDLT